MKIMTNEELLAEAKRIKAAQSLGGKKAKRDPAVYAKAAKKLWRLKKRKQ